MKILVVEDDKKVASFLEKGLREEGYVVDTAHDGAYFNIQDTRDQSGAAVFAGETSGSRYGSVRASSDALVTAPSPGSSIRAW